MKDYAKVINQSKEIHGQQQVRQTLAHSAVQKAKAHKETVPAKKGSGFFTLVAIFVIVAILFAVYRQYIHRKEGAMSTGQATATTAQTAAQPTSPQFDFYTVLPNGGTPGTSSNNSNSPSATNSPGTTTPAATTNAPAGTTTPAVTTTSTTPVTATPSSGAAPSGTTPSATTSAASGSTQYYLNAGEFSNEADAQQTLSQLLLLGVQASIKSVQENGAPSYQVLVGPFDDTDTMSVVKQQLIAHQIQASVVQQ